LKVAVYWYGAEGQASYRYFKEQGHDVTIVTPQVSPEFPLPEGAKSIVQPDAIEHLANFDMVIRSAATRPDSLDTNGKIWSATNEFFAKCRAPIIGVTGTKGKGTTSSLIASILKVAGKKVHLVGNIGVLPLEKLADIMPDEVVVFELSSFQLWDLEKSPHVAVVLMIEPDHLNVHADMEEYVAAKANIRKFQDQDDYCYYHPTNELARKIALTGTWAQDDYEQRVWEELAYRYATPEAVYVQDGNFMRRGNIICPTSAVQLPGEFNLENTCAAISAATHFTVDDNAIEQGIRSFTGLPHRLKLVVEKNGVKYYDDSIATTPGSATAALKSFDGPKVIILGGATKGASYDSLLEQVKSLNAKVVAVGQTGREIAEKCQQLNVNCVYVDGAMDKIVPAAAALADGQGVVLLSPAATSFDQYKSYADRGEKFIAAVEAL
jgi:UDP-N-acetylmuramoylalanine--D-glutamate ligase